MKKYSFREKNNKELFSILGVSFLIPSVIQAEPFPANFELLSLTNSASRVGSVINGEAAGDTSGFSVSQAGDVNGDGLDDLVIGASSADPNMLSAAGASYVVLGKTTSFSAELDLSSLNGSNGFRINGEAAGDASGVAVSEAGDINGDGIEDLVIGASNAANSDGDLAAGVSYVVFGQITPFSSVLNLSSLNGNNGFQINGEAAGNLSGRSVSQAGDINGDGFGDLIIGAPSATPNGNNSGASYVVLGKSTPFDAELDLNSLSGSNGFQINGEMPYDLSGSSVSAAGDVNGDGFDDVIIGAFHPSPVGSGSGASYVILGKPTPFDAELDLNNLNGTNGFQINGEAINDRLGISVSQADDINGDGIDDVIIGAYFADPNGRTNSGASYVIFGQTIPFSSVLNLTNLNGNNGFQINGVVADDFFGASVSQAGDVNGDGVDDLIIGAFGADPNGNNEAGASYVVHGRDYSPQGDFTANFAPDLLTRKGKALRLLPLAINSNQVVSAELPTGSSLSLPSAITPSGDKLARRVKLRATQDFDDSGVSDFLVQTNKNTLKLFKLANYGSPVTPMVLSEINFALPKKHRYFGAGPLIGKEDNKLDLVLRKGKGLFVVENLGPIFSTNLQPITGKLKGKILSIQKGRIIKAKGRKLSQQSISNLVLGATTELGTLAKGQKPLLMLDINQDGKLDVVTLGKKRSVGFVSEDSLSTIPTAIVTLPKKTKVVGPK